MTDTLHYAPLTTPIGEFLVVVSDKGLCALRLVPDGRIKPVLDDVRRGLPDVELVEDAAAVRPMARQVEAVIDGKMPAAKLKLDMRGTPFQKKVWQTLARIPWGKTFTYSELAEKVGKPRAVRAVASACARNPVAFVVPCHRIVAKGGGLGGYYWGLDMKRRLIEREQ